MPAITLRLGVLAALFPVLACAQSPFAAFQQDKQALKNSLTPARVPHSLIVKFRDAAPEAALDGTLAAIGGGEIRRYASVPGLRHLRTALPVPQALALLAADPQVEYAEPDFVVRPDATPNDTYYGLQWGLNNSGQSVNRVAGKADADIDMAEAWNTTTGGGGCLVAVIDTGVQASHPDLDGNLWSNPGEIPGNGLDDDGDGYIDDTRGWDFYAGDNDPDDEDGHGTHVAGTIAARSNNGVGVAGIAWSCKIMPLRFIGPDGGAISDAIAAIDFAVTHGAKVSNNSWGGTNYSAALYDAIRSARDAGHIFVAAAGNDAVNTDSSPHYPSGFDLDNIVSVAATDNTDLLAGFSNYGTATVDLGAPGKDIASTYKGSAYVYMSGTSMASPHVAGVAALVWLKNPGFSYTQVIDRLFATARPVAALSGKTRTGGMLNAQAALAAAANTAPVVDITSPVNGASYASGATVSFSASATDAEDGNLSSSIVWSSSLDGVLGSGASLSTSSLSAGNHIVSARAVDASGLAATDTVAVSIAAAPAAPSSVTATNNRNNSATVRWKDNSGNETGFQIERQKQTASLVWGNSNSFSVAANVVSYTDKSGSGTYRYRVRARNAVGDSAWSDWAQVKVTNR